MNADSTRPIVIGGHSHTIALGVPEYSASGDHQVVALSDRRFEGLTGPWPRDARYWDDLVTVAARRTVALSWNGNQHMAAFLVTSPPVFDFTIRSRPDVPIDASRFLVPELAVREVLGDSFKDLATLVRRMQATGGPPPVLLGTPPPNGDDAWVGARLRAEPLIQQRLDRAGLSWETLEVCPRDVRLKLWLLVQQMMSEIADTLAILFCPTPPEVQCPEGFLREEYYYINITHANEAFGPLMREAIHRTVRRRHAAG